MADSNGNHASAPPAAAKAASFKSQAGIGLHIHNPTGDAGSGHGEEPVVDPQPTPTAHEVEESLRRELERLAGGAAAQPQQPPPPPPQ